MLFEQEYTYFLSQICVNRRGRRYAETEKGLRQYHALDETSRRDGSEKLVRAQKGRGGDRVCHPDGKAAPFMRHKVCGAGRLRHGR